MDIRTKLMFACVAVSLASMLLLGLFMHRTAADIVDDLTARQLDSLASARLEDIQIIRQAWREQAFLISSRTSLRELLLSRSASGASVDPDVQRILDDARRSVTIFRRLTVFDVDNSLVASSGRALNSPAAHPELTDVELSITGFVITDGGGLDAIAHVPLYLEEARVGQLEAVIDTGRLFDITRNYEGLGETGELYLVGELDPGEITVLNTLRGSGTESLLRMPRESAGAVMSAALSGADRTLRGAVDYRGERVWAATRQLPHSPIALVVKIDEREQLQPRHVLRERFVRVATSVAALAILGGALLGAWLARPIRRLHETVEKIRAGEKQLRADVRGEDEVSFLAESFNELMNDQPRTPEA